MRGRFARKIKEQEQTIVKMEHEMEKRSLLSAIQNLTREAGSFTVDSVSVQVEPSVCDTAAQTEQEKTTPAPIPPPPPPPPPMPPGGPPLDPSEITAIRTWIDTGAPDADGNVSNELPVVDAGADRNIQLPATNIEFIANVSDPDGVVLRTVWSIELPGADSPTFRWARLAQRSTAVNWWNVARNFTTLFRLCSTPSARAASGGSVAVR